MKDSMFCVYDSKARAFLPPFVMPNTEMARRAFSNCINSDSHQFGQNPEDYTLMMLGHYDSDNGKITELSPMVSLGIGLEYIRPVNSVNMDLFPEGKEAPTNGKAKESDPRILPGPDGDNSQE